MPLTPEFCCLPKCLAHLGSDCTPGPFCTGPKLGVLSSQLPWNDSVSIWPLASHRLWKPRWGSLQQTLVQAPRQPLRSPAAASSHLTLLLGHTCCAWGLALPLGCSQAFSRTQVSGCLQALDAAERRSWSCRETPNQEGEVQSMPVSSPV